MNYYSRNQLQHEYSIYLITILNPHSLNLDRFQQHFFKKALKSPFTMQMMHN